MPTKLPCRFASVTIGTPDFAFGNLGNDSIPSFPSIRHVTDAGDLNSARVIEFEDIDVCLATIYAGVALQVFHDPPAVL